jgi:hypothetical protein
MDPALASSLFQISNNMCRICRLPRCLLCFSMHWHHDLKLCVSISGFAVCLPSRSARLFSYHYMIRLVMDLACFYLHIAKGNLLQAFMKARHIRLHHGIVNRYSPLTYTNVNAYCKLYEGMNPTQIIVLLLYYEYQCNETVSPPLGSTLEIRCH